MKKMCSLVAPVVFVLTLVARLAATDISGTWTSVFDSHVGRQEYRYTFVVKDTKLTGTIYGSQVGESQIRRGRVNNDAISFVESGTFQGSPFRIYYSGMLTSNNKIVFTRKVVGLGEAAEQIVATRVK
jgi:hypothetical protein